MGYWDEIQQSSTIYKVSFHIVKFTLALLNIGQILFTIWFLYYGIRIIDQQADLETNAMKLEILHLNRTIVILSGIMTSIFCFVGIIGAIRQSYPCIVAYTTIMAVLLIASIFYPGKSKLLNIIIIFTLTLLSAIFTSMLRLKEKTLENTNSFPVANTDDKSDQRSSSTPRPYMA